MKCDICNKEIDKRKSYSAFGHIYCAKHYQQMLKFGHCLDSNPRTTKDLNDFEFSEDGKTVKVITFNQNCEESGSFIIDSDDFEKIIDKKWRVWRDRIYTGNFKPISIHRFLFQKELDENPDLVVDHKDSDPMNNTRNNLRLVTQGENVINKSLQSNNKSGFSGVYWNKNRNKWYVEIAKKPVRIKLGSYAKLEDAVYVRYIAELELFGELRSKKNDQAILEMIGKCQNKDDLKRFTLNKINEKRR